MAHSHEDDSTPSGEDEAVLTPSTEAEASYDPDEPSWLFKGSLLDAALEDRYRPHSAPALAVHRGRLFCLWTGGRDRDSHLYWTSVDSTGRWRSVGEVVDPAAVAKTPVNAWGAPAIADLNGVLHMVFCEGNGDPRLGGETLNNRNMLVHVQYDDQCQTWGKRANLGISTRPCISLKAHADRLYCGYKYANHELGFSIWSECTGWSRSTIVVDSQCGDRSFAFYNLWGSLHMLYASGEGAERSLHDLEVERTLGCWLSSQTPPRPEGPLFGELDVTSCEGQVYIICQGDARRPVLMITDVEGRLIASETVHDERCWNLPALTILNGDLICVWVGGRCDQRKLLWSRRLATPSIAMKEWMSRIDSDVYLSELSIPGSHESCATIAVPWVQCQNISIEDQLNSGLRYFDFRCGVSFGTLYLFHGRSPLGFSLTDVLARMYVWLARAQQEAVIVQIKMEGGSGNETAFEKLLRSEFTGNAKFWALGNTIPKLRAVRGKIQLMRRFHISTGTLGIDVGRWADNSTKFIIPLQQGQRMVVQDRYEYTDVVPTFAELVQAKSSAVAGLIGAVKEDRNREAWYLNWCNAYALPRSLGVVATPADIAMGRNDIVRGRRQFVPGVNSSLFRKNFFAPVKGRYGTILLDFAETPDPALVAAIVMSNTFN